MANILGMIIGGAFFIAGLMFLIIYMLVNNLLSPLNLNSGPFTFNPTWICVIAIIVGFIIMLFSILLPDSDIGYGR
jgi:Na+(H+)/acetate symporter ActP